MVDEAASRRVERIDDQLAIDDALGSLSDDFRVVVVLRDVVDLDYQEIADVLDIPLGTVKSRIARARAQLADELRLDDLPPLPPTPDDPGNPLGMTERPTDTDE